MSTQHTLSANDTILVHQALLSFENPIPKIVDGKEQRQPYDLSDKAKYAIMRNLKRIKPRIDSISEAREDLRILYNPHNLKSIELADEKQMAWDAAHRQLMSGDMEPITFHEVDLSEFHVDKNMTMPMSVIALLLGFVIRDTAPQDGVVD